MQSRDRIAKALQHKEADRVPRDLGATESTGLSAAAFVQTSAYLGTSDVPVIFDPYQYIAYSTEKMKEIFHLDAENLTRGPRKWKAARNPCGFDVMIPEKWNETFHPDETTTVADPGGRIIAKRVREGKYFFNANPILQRLTDFTEADAFKEQIHGFDSPFFADESDEELAQRAKTLHATGRFVVYNFLGHLLAAGQWLRGYENFMVDLICDEKMTHKVLDLLLEGYLARIQRLAPLLKDHIDIVLLNDDLGTQKGPMLSLDLYRKVIKPYQKILFREVKKAFHKPILFHSCGSIRAFLPDLVELGVDAVNPVQLSANDMNIKGLKRDFGKSLTFWGGGIDTQAVLNYGSPNEVRESVKRNIDILAPGGGFVFSQVHNIQADVPIENIIAMYEALDRY